MKIEVLETGIFHTNTYIVFDEENRRGLVIDPGGDYEVIETFLRKYKIRPVYVVATHLHFDHILAVKPILRNFKAKFLYNKKEEELDFNQLNYFARYFGIFLEDIPKANKYVSEGDKIEVGNLTFRVIETPGHTPGSISLIIDEKVFVGDLIFRGGVGRTDLPGGNWEKLVESIKYKILTLPDHYTIYPGHGPETTVGFEKKNNPFI